MKGTVCWINELTLQRFDRCSHVPLDNPAQHWGCWTPIGDCGCRILNPVHVTGWSLSFFQCDSFMLYKYVLSVTRLTSFLLISLSIVWLVCYIYRFEDETPLTLVSWRSRLCWFVQVNLTISPLKIKLHACQLRALQEWVPWWMEPPTPRMTSPWPIVMGAFSVCGRVWKK